MISCKRAALLCVLTAAVSALGAGLGVYFLDSRGAELAEISELVQSEYYLETDEISLYNGAAKGMMRSIGDDYAFYYTPEEYSAVMERRSDEYTGVGMMVGRRGGLYVILSVYDDSPAQAAGILPDDVLLRVNETEVSALQLEELSALMPAKSGETAELTVLRGAQEFRFSLTSAPIVRQRVHFDMLGDIAYIKLDEFSGDCVKGFGLALEKTVSNCAAGLVVDLRDNPGGDLTAVVEIADMLLGRGVILTVRSREGDEEVYESDENRVDLPLAVLINGGSASASEVLSGAVRDHKAGVLIGSRTFGKGIVQTTYALQRSGAHVKLTTAVYCTPSGENIHKKGIEPDIAVSASDDPNTDAQLDAALEALNKR